MPEAYHGRDDSDPWVEGYEIVELDDKDSHLLWIREESDYVEAIRIMSAPRFIQSNLAPILADIGLNPICQLEITEAGYGS